MNAHDFEFTSIDGKALPLADFKGKCILIVNTASECGFTPQYEGLQTLWETYKDKGLVVIGVPSNDFGEQEPGSESEIRTFCHTNYHVDFYLTDKQKVKGEDAHPLYKAISDELGKTAAPKWNFHKYLIAPDGELAELWPSKVEPLSAEVKSAIEENLPA
ncbi:MAG: glutathione peroxidase [Pseudomonadales bacterium]